MRYEHESFNYRGLTIRIVADDDPSDPRTDWAGTMVCFHNRYALGDKHDMSPEEAQELISEIEAGGGIVLPLFLYDHSGITMNTTGFSCPWDSGQVGFIYATAETITKEWSGDYEAARRCLVCEVKCYDDYLTGNVWGYVVEDEHGDELDSCWGFFGDPDKYCRGEALSSARWHVKNIIKNEREHRSQMLSLSIPYAGAGIPA